MKNDDNVKVERLYALRDDKMALFNHPFTMENDSVAVRSFGDAITKADPNSALALHPEDFTLWFVGYFDLSSGAVWSDSDTAIVARGSDFVSIKS